VSVIITYTGTFVDPDLGAQTAQAQMDQGADVIFGCGGLTGNGAILHATQNGAWGVGVDTDQWLSLFGSGSVPGSDKLLTSVMKRIDNAVYDTIADEVGGAFSSGTVTYDLAVDGVGLAPYHEADPSIPQAVKDAVEEVRLGILDGSIDPWQPCTWRQVYLPLVARVHTPPKLTLWHNWSGDYLQEYQAIVAEFNLDHPESGVLLDYKEDMNAALAATIPAGTGPDIVAFANDPIGAWATEGYLEPLDGWIDLQYLEDNFEPAAVDSVLWGDEIWGIPEAQEGIALVYNANLISAAELPEDWADFLVQADQFQQTHPGVYYLCNQGLGGQDAYHAAPIYFGHGLSQYGGYVDEAGNAYMDTAEALAAAEWIAAMRAYGPAETSHPICRDMLINGEAAIWWTGPWAIADLQNASVDYGIEPMGVPFAGVKEYMLTTNAVDRGTDDAAVSFMQYLGSADVQVRLALANRTIPANTAALHDPDVQALYEVAQFGASLSPGVAMPNHVYGDCPWGPVGDATLAIWNGTQTPQEAMDAAQAAIEACVAGIVP
jgi:arabinogalactan oligomer/maltooligosaccharide transport system substrate-binding protein